MPMTKYLFAPIVALICASCTLSIGEEASPDTVPVDPTPTTVPQTTNPPTTVAPTTTRATTTTTVFVPPPPPANAGITVLDCPPIGDMQTSDYFPDDWDVWCAGWLFGEQYVWDNPQICEAFWNVPDTEIMSMWLNEGASRDFAIGALDSLWMNC